MNNEENSASLDSNLILNKANEITCHWNQKATKPGKKLSF